MIIFCSSYYIIFSDAKKAAESLRKEHDALNKKGKVLQGQLKASTADLEAFQVEKQGKLNELWVVVPILTTQIEHSGDFERFPAKKGLVVPSETITRLTKRIEELIVEKDEEKDKYRHARRQHVTLVKGRVLREPLFSVIYYVYPKNDIFL